MKKHFIVGLFIFLFFAVSDTGWGDPLSGEWLLRRDHELDGKVDDYEGNTLLINCKNNNFIGEYNKIESTAIFMGEIFDARSSTVINFIQRHKDFYASHSGQKVGKNKFVGIFYASGNISGDFELIRQ